MHRKLLILPICRLVPAKAPTQMNEMVVVNHGGGGAMILQRESQLDVLVKSGEL